MRDATHAQLVYLQGLMRVLFGKRAGRAVETVKTFPYCFPPFPLIAAGVKWGAEATGFEPTLSTPGYC